jgi:hypothetical protein
MLKSSLRTCTLVGATACKIGEAPLSRNKHTANLENYWVQACTLLAVHWLVPNQHRYATTVLEMASVSVAKAALLKGRLDEYLKANNIYDHIRTILKNSDGSGSEVVRLKLCRWSLDILTGQSMTCRTRQTLQN